MIDRARDERDDDLEEHVGNAIEMAILGKAKRFIKSAAVQKIINSIWSYEKYLSQPEEHYSFVSIVEENVFIKPRVVTLFFLMCVLVTHLAVLSIDLYFRPIRERQSTSMILIRSLCLTIIGAALLN